jgi:hypothetical protein
MPIRDEERFIPPCGNTQVSDMDYLIGDDRAH